MIETGNHLHRAGNADINSGRKITWASIWINFFLIVLKILGGIFGQSRALIADAVHSLSDFITDVIVLVGLHFFGKEGDEDHPYGHGKIETLTAIAVGAILLGASFKIGYDAAVSIYRHDIALPHKYTIIIAALSIGLKEYLYQATVKIGRRLGSEAMIANAWHHRSDAWSSVVVLVGISLATFMPSMHILDSYAALLVSFFIIKVAFDILKGAVRKIVDTSPSREFLEDVSLVTTAVPGVMSCHDLMSRYYADRIRMEIHIEVDPGMTVLEAHEIVDKVVKAIIERHAEVEKVLVHVDPHGKRGVPLK